MFACFLVVDVVTGFGFLFSRLAPNMRGMALVAAFLLSVIAFIQGLRSPVVSEFEVNLASLPKEADGLVIVAISDLHIGTLPGEKWLSERADQVNALHPDLIVMVGDIVEGHGQDGRRAGIVSTFRQFAAPLGVWAVTGNHERYSGFDSSIRLLGDAGVQLLRNEWHEIRPGLILAGIDDISDRRDIGNTAKRIGQALADIPANTATIFLAHRPLGMKEAAGAGAGLMLSGHTHGGQIWPFDYIVKMTNGLLEGRYEVNGMPVIVSRGAGTWGPRMRLWSPGEIIRITLRAS
jgi:predicted MPP superfamily phosphohydrolase